MQSIISASEIIKRAWKIYFDNFSLLIKLMLWVLLPTLALELLQLLKINVATQILSALFMVSIVVLGIWINIVLIYGIRNLYLRKKIDLKKIYEKSWSQFWSYIWVSLLIGLAVLGGLILFIAPGIIFSVWFSFAIYLLLFKGMKGQEALRQSKKLVEGKWWAIFWRWLAPGVFYSLIMIIIISSVNAIIGSFLGNWQIALKQDQPIWWAELVGNLVSVILAPLFASLGIILYQELIKKSNVAAVAAGKIINNNKKTPKRATKTNNAKSATSNSATNKKPQELPKLNRPKKLKNKN